MTVLVAVSVNGAALDPAIVVADVTVRSGRSRADDGLAAASATVDLLSPAPLGGSLQIADQLQIVANGSPRFTGRIGELSVTAGSSPEEATATTIVAVGAIARLSRLLVAMPLPAGTAASRAAALFAAAGIPATIAGGTTFQQAAYGAIGDAPVTADQVVGAIIADTGAVVADTGSGSVLVQFPEARNSGTQRSLNPAATDADLGWEMGDDLVNDCSVDWVGAIATVRANNADSIARYDLHAASLSTGLGDVGSATRRATSIVARLAAPSWQLGSVQTWDEAALTYQVGDVVLVGPLPPDAPVDSPWLGMLEGWTERYQPDTAGGIIGVWDLAIGDPRHSGTLVWSSAAPAEHWATVNPATSWQEVISNADL